MPKQWVCLAVACWWSKSQWGWSESQWGEPASSRTVRLTWTWPCEPALPQSAFPRTQKHTHQESRPPGRRTHFCNTAELVFCSFLEITLVVSVDGGTGKYTEAMTEISDRRSITDRKQWRERARDKEGKRKKDRELISLWIVQLMAGLLCNS